MLITLGYAAASPTGLWGTVVDLVVSYPGMLLAVAGTAALVMVVVTSVKRARARLRYESWHLIHLYAYLGAGLALPHQLWTGQEFLSSRFSTVFWWGLYAVAAGAVLVFRVGRSLWRSLRAPIVVSDVRPEGPGATTVTVSGERARAPAGPGGPVLHLALPVRTRVDPGPPLLGVRCAGRAHAAADGGSPRATAAPGWRGCGRARGCWSRAPTAGCTPASAPAARCS